MRKRVCVWINEKCGREQVNVALHEMGCVRPTDNNNNNR